MKGTTNKHRQNRIYGNRRNRTNFGYTLKILENTTEYKYGVVILRKEGSHEKNILQKIGKSRAITN